MLAVSALDVAFVGALAALATGIASPVSAWLISKQKYGHELNLERERRLFEARRDRYESTLADVFKSVASMHAWQVKVGAVEWPVDPHIPEDALGVDDWLDLQGRLAAIASDEVTTALDGLGQHQLAFWRLITRLTPNEEVIPPTEEEKTELAELARKSRDARDGLAKEMRDDLAGRND